MSSETIVSIFWCLVGLAFPFTVYCAFVMFFRSLKKAELKRAAIENGNVEKAKEKTPLSNCLVFLATAVLDVAIIVLFCSQQVLLDRYLHYVPMILAFSGMGLMIAATLNIVRDNTLERQDIDLLKKGFAIGFILFVIGVILKLCI